MILQHGNNVHIDSMTARVPSTTSPVSGLAHQQIPESHCNSSKLPFDEQCNVTSMRPLDSRACRLRLHAGKDINIHKFYCDIFLAHFDR